MVALLGEISSSLLLNAHLPGENGLFGESSVEVSQPTSFAPAMDGIPASKPAAHGVSSAKVPSHFPNAHPLWKIDRCHLGKNGSFDPRP